MGGACALPVWGFGVYVGEEGGGDVREQCVEVEGGWLGQLAWASVDFGDEEVGGCGFGDGPENGFVVSGGEGALCGVGEALGHAEGETEIDGEREAGSCAVEGTGDGVEDGGVDEAFAGAEMVVGKDEVGGVAGEAAEDRGREGFGAGAEQEAGGGLVLLGKGVGVDETGWWEDEFDAGGGYGWIGEQVQVGGGEMRWGGGVGGGGEEEVAMGKGEGEVGECGLECVGGLGWEGDEDRGGRWRGRGDGRGGSEIGSGVGEGHRRVSSRS